MPNKCLQCGTCCKLFLINLNEEEYKSGRYRTMYEEFGLVDDFEEAVLCDINILETKDDGSCIYLENNKCSIHDRRPQSCRNFFCTSKDPKWKKMIEMINKHKNLKPRHRE